MDSDHTLLDSAAYVIDRRLCAVAWAVRGQ